MSDDDGSRLSSDKKEERAPLDKVLALVPLFALILQILELALKVWGIIE